MDIKDTIIGVITALIGLYYILPVLGVSEFLPKEVSMFLPIILIFLGGYTFVVSFSTVTE